MSAISAVSFFHSVGTQTHKTTAATTKIVEGADKATKLTKLVKSLIDFVGKLVGQCSVGMKELAHHLGGFGEVAEFVMIIPTINDLCDIAAGKVKSALSIAAKTCLAALRFLGTLKFLDKLKLINLGPLAQKVGCVPVLGVFTSAVAFATVTLYTVEDGIALRKLPTEIAEAQRSHLALKLRQIAVANECRGVLESLPTIMSALNLIEQGMSLQKYAVRAGVDLKQLYAETDSVLNKYNVDKIVTRDLAERCAKISCALEKIKKAVKTEAEAKSLGIDTYASLALLARKVTRILLDKPTIESNYETVCRQIRLLDPKRASIEMGAYNQAVRGSISRTSSVEALQKVTEAEKADTLDKVTSAVNFAREIEVYKRKEKISKILGIVDKVIKLAVITLCTISICLVAPGLLAFSSTLMLGVFASSAIVAFAKTFYDAVNQKPILDEKLAPAYAQHKAMGELQFNIEPSV